MHRWFSFKHIEERKKKKDAMLIQADNELKINKERTPYYAFPLYYSTPMP